MALAAAWPDTARAASVGLAGALIAILTAGALTLTYYLGNIDAVAFYLKNTGAFVGSVGNPDSFTRWFGAAVFQAPDVVTLSALLPVLLVAAALVPRWRTVAIVCLPGAVLSTWFIYQRFTTATLFEANFFTLVAVAAWLAYARPRPALSALGLAGVTLLAWFSVAFFASNIYPSYLYSDARERQWARVVASVPGPTLFLIPENEWTFPTVDSAIFKGGTGVNAGEGWGSSPLVRSMFPDRWYFRPDATLAAQKREAPAYTKVAFVRSLEVGGMTATAERIRSAFGVEVESLECLAPAPISAEKAMQLCIAAPTTPAAPAQPEAVSRPAEAVTGDLALQRRALELSALLGAPVTPAPGEPGQFLIRVPREEVDLERVGTIHTDVGYAAGVTLPSREQIGFRFEPAAPGTSIPPAIELSAELGVPVFPVEGKSGQFVIHVSRETVPFTRIGTIHTDVGYAVGVTLPGGDQIGFLFEPSP
jgi:hypothetical protein